MRFHCPHCGQLVVQARNEDGPNFCPKCRGLFEIPPERQMPPWILGVVVFLMGHLQVIHAI